MPDHKDLRAELAGKGLTEEEGGLEVDIKVQVPVFLGGVGQFARLENCGTVDKDVHSAEAGDRPLHEPRGRPRFPQVCLQGLHLDAERPDFRCGGKCRRR